MNPKGTIILFVLFFLSACGGNSSVSDADKTDEELLSSRPYEVMTPSSYDVNTATPLIVVLHGFGGNGSGILSYFRLAESSEKNGFLVAYPNGTRDLNGRSYWNATDACCGATSQPADDVRYLSLLLDDIEANYNVDAKQIYFMGLSNGAFMSHRMACDRSTRVAAIVALAGVSWKDADLCQTEEPVSVLQLHGDLDDAILYDGGFFSGARYPSAIDTVSDWALKNGCTGTLSDNGSNIDIDTVISGNETRLQQFSECPGNGAAELWTIVGGGHVPRFDDASIDYLWEFLSSHAKP